jgi:hypothetical protein
VPAAKAPTPKGPLSDAVAVAVARLVDDARAEKPREPAHSDIDYQISRVGLSSADPKTHGQSVGKAKRIRAVLTWALENAPDNGEILVAALVSLIRAKGGFRESSPNFTGTEAMRDAKDVFRVEGYELSDDGELQPIAMDTLSGHALTSALEAYVRRARRGSQDAALLVGSGKDLVEATAAHILQERFGHYPKESNLPTLLGQAFTALGLSTPEAPRQVGEPAQRRLERALYEAGCAVNALRNKEGTGHGRPWLTTVSDLEAHASIQLIGIVSSFLLTAHKMKP